MISKMKQEVENTFPLGEWIDFKAGPKGDKNYPAMMTVAEEDGKTKVTLTVKPLGELKEGEDPEDPKNQRREVRYMENADLMVWQTFSKGTYFTRKYKRTEKKQTFSKGTYFTRKYKRTEK